MKKIFLLLITPLSLVRGAVVIDKPMIKVPENYGRYAIFYDEVTKQKFELYAENYSQPTKIITVNSDDIQADFATSRRQSYHVRDDREVSETGLVTRQGVCERIAGCLGQAAGTVFEASLAVAQLTLDKCLLWYHSIRHYFGENNYQNVNTILQSFFVGLIVNLVSTPIADLIVKSIHRRTEKTSGNSCSKDEREVLKSDFADAVYNFCRTIHDTKQTTNVPTQYYAGDVPSPGTADGGRLAITKAFISSQADT